MGTEGEIRVVLEVGDQVEGRVGVVLGLVWVANLVVVVAKVGMRVAVVEVGGEGEEGVVEGLGGVGEVGERVVGEGMGWGLEVGRRRSEAAGRKHADGREEGTQVGIGGYLMDKWIVILPWKTIGAFVCCL